jgi:hypothetical protein
MQNNIEKVSGRVPSSNPERNTDYPVWGVFVIFLSLSSQMPGYYLEIGHDSLLLYAFRFIIQQSPSMLYYLN